MGFYLYNEQLKDDIRIHNARLIPGANGQLIVLFNIDKHLFIQNKETIQKIIGYDIMQSDNKHKKKFMDYKIIEKDFETITVYYELYEGILTLYSEGVRDDEDPLFEMSFEYVKPNENISDSQNIHIEGCNCPQCREKT